MTDRESLQSYMQTHFSTVRPGPKPDGLSNQEMARRLEVALRRHVSKSAVYYWKTGQRRVPADVAAWVAKQRKAGK